VNGVRFFFDAKDMELKKANEKRQVIFGFRHAAEDGTLVFDVAYSERGRVTKVDDILRAAKQAGHELDDETLNQAMRVFEKQSEVDYFINKNARAFLQEQFELWMYQYLFAGKNVWDAERLAQLQTLKAIAFKVIDFISQFEDELVKVWNKPKFVRNSHYILTLDHILPAADLWKKIKAHPGMAAQLAEWQALGMIEKGFKLELITTPDLTGAPLHPQYQHLPLDTRHFPDLELEMLALFDDLDAALDGWLVHSENYQALNTMLPKFRGRVKAIHIDPPYNTETSGFLYANTYLHSSWLTMMENRIACSLPLLSNDGSFLCHIDENEYERLKLLFDKYSIPHVGTIIWDKKNPMLGRKGIATQHEYIIWCSHQTSSIYLRNDSILSILQNVKKIIKKHGGTTEQAQKDFLKWINNNSELSGGEKAYRYLDEDGRIFQSVSLGAPEPRKDKKFFIPLLHPKTKKPCPIPSNGFSRTPETLQVMQSRNEIIFGDDETGQPRRKVFLTKESKRQISSVIRDASRGKMDVDKLGLEFPYCHPVSLYEKTNGAATDSSSNQIVADYFAGSGTTAHSIMNLNRSDDGQRKYILVEMGEHFETVLLPRVKKVAFCSKWKNGKPVFEKDEGGMSHFVKYYELEQYEDALRRARYADADLFNNPFDDPYHQYVFLRDTKMLDSVEIDAAQDQVHFHPERLYADIDLAETLSNLRGKWIKRITAETVEFADGETMSLSDPDWHTIKPLVWW
jgi:adenine-specific DNA-methyltransferase